MHKLVIGIIILIITVIFYWVCSVKLLNWGPECDWKFYASVIYIMNLIAWFLMVGLVDHTIFNTDKKMVFALLFSMPIFSFFLIPLNLYLFKRRNNNDGRFFKKLQAVFEVVLHLLTFSLILVTLTALISRSLQMDILLYIIIIYLPAVPIIGSLKLINA